MVLFFALASDLMFFIALVSAFFARQSSGHFTANNTWIIDWHPVAIPPILWINTALILLSSLTMEIGRRHFFREIDVMEEWLGLGRPTIRRAAPWLAATVLLGALFLAGQWIAWKQLVAQGVFFASNPSSHFFLPDYRHPRPALADWCSWIGRRDGGPRLPAPHRTATGSGRLHRLVLAHHGCLLDLPLRHACLLPMNPS